jgi:protein-L-isoaspartate(D-aspartate) O-methyltransferase
VPADAERPGERTGAQDAVWAAMRTMDRSAFLPPGQRRWAGQDRPLDIGHGQTSSQPSTVAAMLRLLQVPRGTRVLDVGSGSGWTTALLAYLVGPDGEVLGLERDARLTEWGAANVAAAGVPWASVERAAPGVLGRPDGGYDRILVSAAAERLPRSLVDQLLPGGRMVVPVRHAMTLVVRDPAGDGFRTTEHGTYSFVPLVEDPPG